MKDSITYIFLSGRKSRLGKEFPNDFFYFFKYFNNKEYDLSILEMEEEIIKKGLGCKLFYFIDKLIIKITKLPFYSHKVLTKKNRFIIKKSKHLILTNETIAYSLLLYLIFLKIFYKKNILLFVMGLMNNHNKNIINKFILKVIFNTYDKFIFLSENEFNFASLNYFSYKKKFNFIPFSVDKNFWSEKFTSNNEKNQIIFIGNDLHRDYNFLKILLSLNEFKFTIVSNKFTEKINRQNLQIINSDWKQNSLDDFEIREIYSKSFVSIIPLKNSLQPSGQSVAMQSISMGVPVIITKTDGFWDATNFIHNKNIILLEENNLNIWQSYINKLKNDLEFRNSIIKSSKKTLIENYNQDDLYKKFLKILFS